MKPRTSSPLITLLFAVSGLCGLIYEIVWVRYFGLVFGNTVFASSTVLSVFMGGLALGSFLFGRYIDRRRNALAVYALLEAGIGVAGLLVPVLIRAASPLYVFVFLHFNPSFYSLSLVRLVVSCLILIVPCTLMGGTLPVISRFIAGAFAGDPGRQAGRLYAANTLGATLGCLASGYVLVGSIGLMGTTALAALCNFVIAVAAFFYAKRFDGAASRDADDPAGSATSAGTDLPAVQEWQATLVTVLYGAAGFLSLFLEVAWTRALVWIMGMDTYAFSSMLAVFLCSMALGSFLAARFFTAPRRALPLLGVMELLIGISAALSLFLVANMYTLQRHFATVFTSTSFWSASALLLAMAAAVMALPALFMGMAFPLALKIGLARKKAVGAGVGTIYGANTIGSVFGSLAAGFVALPLIGAMRSILWAAAVFILIAAALFMAARNFRGIAAGAAAVILAALSVLLFTRSPDLGSVLTKGLAFDERLIYFKETVTGDVEVTESSSEGRIIRIDGREVASSGPTDLPGLLYPSHLVSLLKPNPANVLFVALGAGGSAGSILKYDELKRLDVVEICDGVVEPAHRYFAEMNCAALDDPRLHLIIQDGKNFVRLTQNRYDIIFSGPIHPQSNQGSAALYTRDFFEDCRKRLTPGGIMCIWIPLHMPPDDYKTIARTFLQVFPHSSLWLTSNSTNTVTHTHLIGSDDPVEIDFARVTEKLREPAVRGDISRLGYITLADGYDFLGQYVLGESGLRTFTSGIKQLNTDNLPTAEFSKKIGRKVYPKNRECPALLLADILRCRESPGALVTDIPDSERIGFENRLSVNCVGDSLRILGHIANIRCNLLLENPKCSEQDFLRALEFYKEAYTDYSRALVYFPNDRYLKQFMLDAARGMQRN